MKLLLKYLYVLIFSAFITNTIKAQQLTEVTLQLKWKHQFQFAGYYAAIEKGFYKEARIHVNLIEAIEGQNPTDAVFEGKAQFGICTSDILLTRSQKKNAVVLATIFQHSPQILIASKKSGIEHVQDLIGKRVAIEPNSADIIAYLNDEGVSLDKCIIDQHTFNTDLLIAGKIDAISAYSTDEPFMLKQANFDYSILSPPMGGIDFYGEGLFTTEELIKKNPALVDSFRKASLKGWKYAMDNPEEIIQLIYNKYSQRHSLEHLRFEASHMKNLIMADVVEIGYTNSGRWESISNIYKKLKMLNPSFSTKGLLYNDYLKPELSIPWDIIKILVLIILVISTAAYFYYNSSQKLKKEIRSRKKLESFLLEGDEKYHTLFANSPDAYLIIIDGVFADCNQATERILGYNREQIIGNPPAFFSPEFQPDGRKSAESANEIIREALRNGKNTFEWVHRKYDGSEFMVEVSIGLMKLQGKPALFTTWRDISERKLAEELLKASETRFKTIFNEAPLGIALIDSSTGHIYEVNPMFAKITERTLEEIVNIDWMSITHPDDIHADLANMAAMNAGKTNGFQMEKRYLNKEGSSIWINMTIASIDVEDKAHPQHLCMIENITERKRAREEKRKIDDQIRTLSLAIEQSPVVTVITDVTGNIEFANPKFYEITGYSAEEVIGKNPRILSSGNKSRSEYKELWETILSGRNWHGVFRNKKKNGEFYWESAIISPVKNEEGAITHFLAVKEDITERKQSKKMLQDIISENPISIQILNKNGYTIQGNPAFIKLFGTIPPPDFSIFADLQSKSPEFEKLILFAKNGEVVHFPDMYYNLNDISPDFPDNPLWISAFIFPLNNGSGKPEQFVLMHENITERKKTEQIIQFQNQELISLNSDKDRFISILAHDLKNPFNTILGYLELLTENIRKYDIDKIEKQIAIINNSAQNTYNLLLDILLWARSQSGKIPFEPKELICNDICKTVLPEMQFLADTKRITISHSSDDDVAIFADIDMLKTILRNLISNAIKFTNHGGKINISIKQQADSQIISVSDDGVGMVSDILNKLFESTRIHSTMGTANESGTGLGLMICKEFVEKHGGRIWAESKPGKGSTFYFTLPIKNIV